MREPEGSLLSATGSAIQLHSVTLPIVVSGELTRSSVKRQLYSVDTYFRDSWEDLSRLARTEADPVTSRHAFLLLKPDAVVRRRLTVALDWLTARGWIVVHAHRFRVNRWAVRAFWQYQWNTATRDRREMADSYMAATDSLVLILRAGIDQGWATSALTRVKGVSDPIECRPGSLRHALGTLNQQLNLVHTADEPADLVREVGICCTAAERATVYRAMADRIDAAETAYRLAARMEAEQEELDLSLDATVHRVIERVSLSGELRARLGGLLAGEPVDWRELVELADRCGVALSGWDRVALGTYLLIPTLAGVAPLIPDASADQEALSLS
jgi:nucleoside diphosphate kinase